MKNLYDKLKAFDFSDEVRFIYSSEYDLTNNDDVELIDNDSADANACVKALDLSYTIDAKHYSTCVRGDRSHDMVTVIWEFWREADVG